MRRKYVANVSYWLVKRFRSFLRQVPPTLRIVALTVKWGRIPNPWELSFIGRMRELEKKGLAFHEVLSSTLPQLFGEDTSEILSSWMGRKARCNPEQFTRTISKMFGASARSVIVSIDRFSDEVSLLEKNTPPEPPYRSILDAIRKAEEGMTVAQPSKPQERP